MKAYEIIEKPENWTQGWNAKDAEGLPVLADSAEAKCFCLNGSIIRAYGNTRKTANEQLRAVCDALKTPYPQVWNDAPERTHADVYKLLKSLDI